MVPLEKKNEILTQFKTDDDLNNSIKEDRSQVLEKMLEGDIYYHLGYEKNSPKGKTVETSAKEYFPRIINTAHDNVTNDYR